MKVELQLYLKWGPKRGPVAESDIYCVDEIILNFSRVTYILTDSSYNIQIDWSQLKTLVKATFDTTSRFYKEIDGQLFKQASKTEEMVVPITITSDKEMSLHSAYEVIERLLIDIYVISNLSVPGIFDLYDPKLVMKGDVVRKLKPLHSFYFEELSDDSAFNKYPFPHIVKFSQVHKWYKSLKIGESSRARSSAEQAVYSLLHITTIEQEEIGIVPWVFCALESIFETDVGRGGKQLKDQAVFLLKPKDEHKGRFLQKLDKLANLRHSFIHGGYTVPSLYPDELNDDEFDLVSFGVVLIILCIQRLAENNWSGLKIDPVVTPKLIDM